jgi:hypothetical protein
MLTPLYTQTRRPSIAAPEPAYRAFLLRCWREAGAGLGGRNAWRFCLVEPGDAQTERGFPDLEALVTYLRRELRRQLGRRDGQRPQQPEPDQRHLQRQQR